MLCAPRRKITQRNYRDPFTVERLEVRQMLSAAPPTVVDVSVASTTWSSSFVSYLASHNLGNGGYSVPVGSSAELSPLPWTSIDQIRITFSEDVNVQESDMSLTGVNVTQYAFANFSYDASSHVAVWTLAQPIGADNLLININGSQLGAVTNQEGTALDGEWKSGSSVYASGDGNPGGDFAFQFNVLPGDDNQSGVVTAADYTRMVAVRNANTTSTNYDPMRDIDGSGTIDTTDLSIVLGKIGTTAPTGNPAGMSNHAPTTSGLATLQVSQNAPNQSISLFGAFQDAENNSDQLTYQVMSNSNSSLVNSATIDPATGQLTLAFAENTSGQADLVIRATDEGGLFVETTQHVVVDAPPVISNFVGTTNVGQIWTFSGTVTDASMNPAGWTVNFYGILQGQVAMVQSDGTFELTTELASGTDGDIWVQTADPLGLASNQPEVYVSI